MAARVLTLSEILEENESFGKKINDLINLATHGFEIADSFVITHQAYLDFLKENNLDNKIKHLLSAGLDEEAIKHLRNSRLPAVLIKEVLKAYKNLGTVLEDAEVKINGEKIKGDATLIEKVRKLWITLYPSENATIIIQKVHFGKHGKVRTSSKFINSIHPFSINETTLLENMLSKFKNLFFLPHEIDFTLEKGKVIINRIRPETHVGAESAPHETGYKIIVNSHY